MSSKLLGAAWSHLPWSGGMLVLALKLVDNAHDDGRHIFPSVDELAARTKQSDRTVQRQLRAMEASGWLVCEERSNGGRNRSSRYRIAAQWVADPGAFVFRDDGGAGANEAGSAAAPSSVSACVAERRGGRSGKNSGLETVTAPAQKPRQNVTVSSRSTSPETVTSATETVTPVSGAYNPQIKQPSVNPLSCEIEEEGQSEPPVDQPGIGQAGPEPDRSAGGVVPAGKWGLVGHGFALEADNALPGAGAREPDPDPATADDRRIAEWMFGCILRLHPGHRAPPWRRWLRTIRLMRERDQRTRHEICAMFRWANAHPFWHANILSPDKLRKQWDALVIRQKTEAVPVAAYRSAGVAIASSGASVEIDKRCRWLEGTARCEHRGVSALGHGLGAQWFCAGHIAAARDRRERAQV